MSWSDRLNERLWSLGSASRAIVGLARERVESGIAFNPFHRELREDPYPTYRRLREASPVHRSRAADGWVLTRYDDVLEALGDRSFSSDERHMQRYETFRKRRVKAGLPDMYAEGNASMLRVDAPDHTRLRSLVNKAFTPRQVEAMRPRIETLVDELLKDHGPGGRMSLLRDFAAPLPVIVIAEMLGVPSEDRHQFHAWSEEAIRTLGNASIDDQRASWQAMEAMGAYFEEKIEERRREPRNDLLSNLAAAEEAGDRLSNDELFTMLVLILVAGNETTTKLICNAVVALDQNPDQLEILRRHPEKIPAAVDELLRYDSPVQFTSRMITEDRHAFGVDMKKGQQLIVLLGAANRDPARFADPDRLDVEREDVRHVSFSHGAHFCLGAQLARLEGALALEALITRYPDLRVDGPVVWGNNPILRGPVEVPLAL